MRPLLSLVTSLIICTINAWDPKCTIPPESGCDTGNLCKSYNPLKSECQINLDTICTLPYGDNPSSSCHCAKSLCGELFCASTPNDDPCYWLKNTDDPNDILLCNNDMDCVIGSDNGDWNGPKRSRCVNINYYKCNCDDVFKKPPKTIAKGVCVPTCNFFDDSDDSGCNGNIDGNGVLLGITSSGGGDFVCLNTVTGAASLIAPISGGASAAIPSDIDFDHVTGRMFFVNPVDQRVSEINPLTGSIISQFSTAPHRFNALEYVGSILYGMTAPAANAELRTLDPLTGITTLISVTTHTRIPGIAYDCDEDIMYGVAGYFEDGAPSVLVQIDLSNGMTTTIGPTGITWLTSLQFGPDGRLYAGTTVDQGNRLYEVNKMTGAVNLIGFLGGGIQDVKGLTLCNHANCPVCPGP